MAYGKRRRYRRRGRRYYKKYAPVSLTARVVPPSIVVKLPYVTSLQLNPTALAAAQHNFRANSIHDPDETGVGHQPLGHDQWAAFYNSYTVLASKISVQFISRDSNVTTGAAVVGVTLDADSALAGTLETIEEQYDTVHRVMGNAYGNRGIVSLRKGFNSRKFFGIGDPTTSTAGRTFFGFNPGDQAHFIVWAISVSTSDPSILDVRVKITYIVHLGQRLTLATS